jgi:hypothetical protein
MAASRQDFPVAETYHLEALDLRQKIYGENHVQTARSHSALGAIYHSLNELSDASLHYGRAVDIFEEDLGGSWAHYELIAEPYAKILRATGDRKAARVARARYTKAKRIAATMAKTARKKAKKEAVFSY